jgi:hypothetical protein
MIRRVLAPAAAALLLAACSGSSDEPAPSDTNMTEAPIVENMGFDAMVPPIAPDANMTAPEPTPTPEPTPVVEPDAQVQEDADAVGMTARVDRGAGAANETQSAEERTKQD